MKKTLTYITLALTLLSCTELDVSVPEKVQGTLDVDAPVFIELNIDDEIVTLKGSCSEGAEAVRVMTRPEDEWIIPFVEKESSDKFTIKLYIDKNTGIEEREGELSIFAKRCPETVVVKMLQPAGSFIKLEPEVDDGMENHSKNFHAAGGTSNMIFHASVPYRFYLTEEYFEPDPDGSNFNEAQKIDWVHLGQPDARGILPVTVDPIPEKESSRDANLWAVEILEEGEERLPIMQSYFIRQFDEIHHISGIFGFKNKMFAKWNTGKQPFEMTEGTIELLVSGDFEPNYGLKPVMGVTNLFMLCCEKEGWLSLEQAGQKVEFKDHLMGRESGWEHLALTVSSGVVKIYSNGQLVGETPLLGGGIPLAFPWGEDEFSQRMTWTFAMDEKENYLWADISEIRIWNRALTPAELKVPGHFYRVDPASDGLLYYWPFESLYTAIIPNRSLYNPVPESLYLYSSGRDGLSPYSCYRTYTRGRSTDE